MSFNDPYNFSPKVMSSENTPEKDFGVMNYLEPQFESHDNQTQIFILGQQNARDLGGFNISSLLLPRPQVSKQYIDILFNTQTFLDIDNFLPNQNIVLPPNVEVYFHERLGLKTIGSRSSYRFVKSIVTNSNLKVAGAFFGG